MQITSPSNRDIVILCVITTAIIVILTYPRYNQSGSAVTSSSILSYPLQDNWQESNNLSKVNTTPSPILTRNNGSPSKPYTEEDISGNSINQSLNSKVLELTNDLKLNETQSSKTTNSSTINLSTPSNENLHLKPPNQTWASSQMDTVFSMLGYVYHEPNNWHDCQHPATTYFFKNINTIFTGVPKSGCSNWLEALLEAEGTLTHPLERTQVFKVHGALSKPHRMNSVLNRLRSIHENFSFAVVRNPWTRMVSGYRDKLSDEITQGHAQRSLGMNIVEEMRGITDRTELKKLYPTFEEYLRWLVTHRGTTNRHFMPQHKILCIPSSQYEFIVPLEYSDTMNSLIWSKIHSTAHLLSSYDSADDPRKQSSAKRAREWFLKIDQIIIDQLYDLYQEDFALLNYSNFTDPDFPLPIHDS